MTIARKFLISALLLAGCSQQTFDEDDEIDDALIVASFTNGGFESGKLPWTGWGTHVVLVSNPSIDISHAAALSAGASAVRTLKQVVEVAPGAKYNFAASIRSINGAAAHVEIRWLKGTTRLRTDRFGDTTSANVGYQQRSASLSSPATATKVEVRLIVGEGSGTGYFDNISMIRASITDGGTVVDSGSTIDGSSPTDGGSRPDIGSLPDIGSRPVDGGSADGGVNSSMRISPTSYRFPGVASVEQTVFYVYRLKPTKLSISVSPNFSLVPSGTTQTLGCDANVWSLANGVYSCWIGVRNITTSTPKFGDLTVSDELTKVSAFLSTNTVNGGAQ